jgi:hypothetical protein
LDDLNKQQSNGGPSLARRSISGQPPLPPTAKQQLQQQQQKMQQQQQQRLSPDVLEQHANSNSGPGSGSQPGESSSSSLAKRVRASMESMGSKASSGARSGTARSTRSSFAQEAVPGQDDDVELDAYGRPSFAAFETSLKGRGGWDRELEILTLSSKQQEWQLRLLVVGCVGNGGQHDGNSFWHVCLSVAGLIQSTGL